MKPVSGGIRGGRVFASGDENPGLVRLMLEELEMVRYIEMKDGRAYPLDSQQT